MRRGRCANGTVKGQVRAACQAGRSPLRERLRAAEVASRPRPGRDVAHLLPETENVLMWVSSLPEDVDPGRVGS